MKLLKVTYHLVAALALLNLFIMGGVVAYLAGQQRLTTEKLRSAVELFKPEVAVVEGEAARGAEAATAEAATGTATGGATQASPEEREIARMNLERVTRAAEDQLKYSSRMMVDIERRREDLQREKDALEKERGAARSASSSESFQKELEVISLLKPKIALDNLLAMDQDSAARLLQAMESRTAKKILEAASKDPAKWAPMLQIQDKLRAEASEEDATTNGAATAAAKP